MAGPGGGAGGGPLSVFTTSAAHHSLQEAIMSRMRPFGLTVSMPRMAPFGLPVSIAESEILDEG